MNDSWIALVDRHGLREFVLETEHIVPFALRRAERENAACFWVVLRPRHAELVEQLRLMGSPATALQLLEQLAIHMGRISEDEPISQWSDEDVTIPDDRDKEWSN